MKNQRNEIIDEFKKQLKSIPELQNAVWNQKTPPSRNVYPCLTFYIEDEVITELGIVNGKQEQREALIIINVWVRLKQDFEQLELELSNLVHAVETKIKKPGACKYLKHLDNNFGVSPLDNSIHGAMMSYSVQYSVIKS